MLDNTPKDKQSAVVDVLLATRDKHMSCIIISLLNDK